MEKKHSNKAESLERLKWLRLILDDTFYHRDFIIIDNEVYEDLVQYLDELVHMIKNVN